MSGSLNVDSAYCDVVEADAALNGMPKTIPVVDLDMTVRNVLRRMLEISGYHALVARGFIEGMNVYRRDFVF